MSVTYETRGRVAVIRHDDGKANVYSHEALSELEGAIEAAVADTAVGAVVLAGRPGRFSAGFDLATMTASAESMRNLVKAGARFDAKLVLAPVPVVAACTGHALAAGALVLLASDVRIGAAGAWKLGLNEVSIGMALPRWAIELARYRIPAAQFERRVLFGQTATPEEAVEAGFLDRVVPPEQVEEAALEAAAELAGLRRGAVAGTKQRARGELARRMLEDLDEDLATVTVPQPG